jgi:K+-sensing histidine kinase KdpD
MTRRPTRSLSERFDRWLLANLVWRAGARTHARSVPAEPTPPAPRRRLLVGGVVVGVVLPVLVAGLLVLVRDLIAPTTAVLILVVPVVLVTLLAGRVPGLVAAVAAALAFDVLLTRPYYSLTIAAADDLEAAVVLGLIALVVAALVSRELEARTRSTSRKVGITAFCASAHALAASDPDRLVAATTDGMRDVLGLRECAWAPGYHGTVGRVLERDGRLRDTSADLAVLPDDVELPIVAAGHELGRVVMRPTPGQVVSEEERQVAVALADLLAVGLARSRAV